MYARITTYHAKPEKIEEMAGRVDAVKAEVAKIPGIVASYTVWRADGKGVTTGIWESKEACEAGSEAVKNIWAGLADYLAGPPEVEAYESVAKMAG